MSKMADPPRIPSTEVKSAPIAAVGSAEQELLDQLLREGLSSSDATNGHGDASLDIARYRKLLEVLFKTCILKPIQSVPALATQVGLEQALLTLSILSRQTASRPEVLMSLPPPGDKDEAQEPLYAWLTTRILIAATQYEDTVGANELVDALCEAAISMLGALGRDLSSANATYMAGPKRVIKILKGLCQFARDSIDQKPASLLGFSDIPSDQDRIASLFALHLVLQTPAPFGNDVLAEASSLLSSIGQQLPFMAIRRQSRYASIVSAAVKNTSVRHLMRRPCVAVVSLPGVDDDSWQEAVQNLVMTVDQCGDDTLRRDVWQTLLLQVKTLELDTAVDRQKVLLLLRPVYPHLSHKLIEESLGHEHLERWSQASGGFTNLRDELRQYIRLPAPTSVKRKREHSSVDQKARALLRAKAPALHLTGDIFETLPQSLTDLDPSISFSLLESAPALVCVLAQCSETHQALPRSIYSAWFDSWTKVDDDHLLMRALGVLFHHTENEIVTSASWAKPLWRAMRALKSEDRRIRIAAGNLVSALYQALSSSTVQASRIRAYQHIVTKLSPLLASSSYPVQETATLVLGDMGRNANDRDLCDILEILIRQLGARSSPLRSLAYTQLVEIASHRGRPPYKLLSPYFERIGILLAECLVKSPEVVAETMQFIGFNRLTFFKLEVVRKAVIPTLVVRRNLSALETLATIFGQRLGMILIDEGAAILAKIFLTPSQTASALDFVSSVLNDLINNGTSASTTLDKYIRASIAPLIVTIVIELGDEDENAQESAKQALNAVQRIEQGSGANTGDLGAFLKPHMLGVLALMNEQLTTPRTPADSRQKIIRSTQMLISLVGDSMASFSPQIVASLQSTLDAPELRLETLNTWRVFVELLRFSDVGPFIGPTIAALISSWQSFNVEERAVTKNIIEHIAGNAAHLDQYRDDIVRFDHIDELASLSKRLLSYRDSWLTKDYLAKLVERTDSKNVAISTESMRELRGLFLQKYSDLLQLVRGDTFDPVVSQVLRSLLSACARDGDCDDLRDLAYECFGIIGALDPDRLVTIPEETSMTLLSNFGDHEESVDFALHLVRDLLVGAFRSTNDTKHQKNLAFAIQELLKFCGFDSRLVNRQGTVAPRVRHRWEQLPKDVLETVTPLLDARFMQTQVKTTVFEYPIYPNMQTYREWVQAWTVDLIGRVMDAGQVGHGGDAQRIFGVFNSEPRNQDVAVAHHILPHLVLHVLLSGDSDSRERIQLEIHDVLRDQVSRAHDPHNADKRMLSSQVIFDLMDHLSKWLRLARSDRDRLSHARPVYQLLSSIDTELAANAALKSRAFARSLRNFEERIFHLRNRENRGNAELQTYFESLHEIYAELDEPDGMEGVSAFVVSPTLELQIREHESTGRWTAAQSCWEVRLQHSPDDINLHLGLLKCLKNLGHYDTLRTHIRGVLGRRPEWEDALAPFMAEAPWTKSHWEDVRGIAHPPPIAKALLAVNFGGDVPAALTEARREIGSSISSRQYSRAYDSILQLHMLREVEMIHQTDQLVQSYAPDQPNAFAIKRKMTHQLISVLSERFLTTFPSFRAREEILSKRRTSFSLVRHQRLRPELGQAWIQSARIARKAGYEQTAYSDALQAKETDAPFAFIQQAKLIRAQGGTLKALHELEHPVANLIKQSEQSADVIDLTLDGESGKKTEDDFRKDRSLAKAVLLEARWMHEADRFDQNEVIKRFRKAIELGDNLEAPYFHLGHYYDSRAANTNGAEEISAYNYFTCINYIEALQRGVKYIYQTMPRLLTVWLDLGEHKDIKRPNVAHHLNLINKQMEKTRGKILTYQFLTAFPQMISRITHPNKDVQEILVKLTYRVLRDYPAQSLWPIIGAVESKRKDRQQVIELVLRKAVANSNPDLQSRIDDAKRLSSTLLRLAEDKPEKVREVSINQKYPYVRHAFPSNMILPLQDALTVSLPLPGATLKGHQPFPNANVTIIDISDRVEIMPSLQQPKKLVFKGSDGKRYPFLCKPHDDLRKDARLMDFNSMINKLLQSHSESRRRHLYIRTYAVVPLNEECGLIEWVSNTNAFKSLLEKAYERHKKKLYSAEVYNALDQARKSSNPDEQLPRVFRNKVLPIYKPSVFLEWFLINWPEPSAWLNARTNYARTLAVMSMIGYVLGLGDRHCENILFDGITGDTVHVDLNCLFDKAKTLEVPERVPFRLTHNMVDALGVTGVEGVFRRAAEITMENLRANSDSLMSVLEAFVHDPLVEWTRSSRSRTAEQVRQSADRNLKPIQMKLRGVMGETERTVANQVEALIEQATSINNLSKMYVGWAPWC